MLKTLLLVCVGHSLYDHFRCFSFQYFSRIEKPPINGEAEQLVKLLSKGIEACCLNGALLETRTVF